MTALQLRRRTLLLESDLNRLTLHAECEHLHKAVGWLGRMRDARRHIAPWALVLAPLAGVALMLGLRLSSSGSGWLAKALAVAPSLMQLWRTCMTPSDRSE